LPGNYWSSHSSNPHLCPGRSSRHGPLPRTYWALGPRYRRADHMSAVLRGDVNIRPTRPSDQRAGTHAYPSLFSGKIAS